MNLKKTVGLGLTTIALGLIIMGEANAASVSVKCEVRNGRAKASIDGASLTAGSYSAKLSSGGVTVKSKANQTAVGGEVGFDFDSNRADINAGATAIPSTFIKNNTVTGSIFKGTTAVAGATAVCRTK